MQKLPLLLAVAGSIALAGACSASKSSTLFDNGNGGAGGDQAGPGAGNTSNGTGDSSSTLSGLGIDGGPTGAGGSTGAPCVSGPNADMDKDGWTVAQGDCNDCDPNVNPGAVDTPAQPDGDGGMTKASDNDCDGTINVNVVCDANIAVGTADPMDGVKAVDLCVKQPPAVAGQPAKWGVKGANWVLPDGSPPPQDAQENANFHLGHGVLSAMGPNVKVQAGMRMLGLSSGTARQPTDPGYQDVSGFDKGYTSNSPQGFPKESPACPGVTTGQPHDGTALEVVIHTPSNAHGFSFDFDFFTYEWPDWICSEFNDFFVAILSPIPMGQTDGNISFDSQGNPVSVNNAFLQVCGCGGPSMCQAGGKNFNCSLGDGPLVGTGWGQDTAGSDHGSTYWLVTKAPVEPASDIIIRWGVYDSSDGVLDTSSFIDNWQWIATAGELSVGTVMVPTPK